MIIALMVIHIIISAALVMSILVQTSKGGALDGLVGGAATNALGGQGASKFLKQSTAILTFLFVASCVFFAVTLKNVRPGNASSKAVDLLKKEVKKEVPVTDTKPLPTATETTE